MRAAAIGGPLAVMLGPDTPALAVFGDSLDGMVGSLAKRLSEMSNFPVIVRRTADNPIPKFIAVVPTSAPTDSGKTFSSKLERQNVATKEAEQQQSEAQGEGQGLSTGEALRLRGGAGSDDDLPVKGKEGPAMKESESHLHTAKITLDLEVDGQSATEIDILTELKVCCGGRVHQLGLNF